MASLVRTATNENVNMAEKEKDFNPLEAAGVTLDAEHSLSRQLSGTIKTDTTGAQNDELLNARDAMCDVRVVHGRLEKIAQVHSAPRQRPGACPHCWRAADFPRHLRSGRVGR